MTYPEAVSEDVLLLKQHETAEGDCKRLSFFLRQPGPSVFLNEHYGGPLFQIKQPPSYTIAFSGGCYCHVSLPRYSKSTNPFLSLCRLWTVVILARRYQSYHSYIYRFPQIIQIVYVRACCLLQRESKGVNGVQNQPTPSLYYVGYRPVELLRPGTKNIPKQLVPSYTRSFTYRYNYCTLIPKAFEINQSLPYNYVVYRLS